MLHSFCAAATNNRWVSSDWLNRRKDKSTRENAWVSSSQIGALAQAMASRLEHELERELMRQLEHNGQ